MKKTRCFIAITLLLYFLATFNISCEKPEVKPNLPTPEPPEQELSTKDKLVGTWVRVYTQENDTIVFAEDGNCSYIIGGYYTADGSSLIMEYCYETSEHFLILYNNLANYNPWPHVIEFYDDNTFFKMYNSPWGFVENDAYFRKIE